ncbi:MAG: 2-C-methyl-D-erythritol 4-phosphate cytidylyltransferase [Candidatus Omnitrophica bacterium]|nr:2-C-methyl-D-erythritol 4-phosphate cytidylyltransferase [Candidatus Omnitrophota bacterium]
MNLKVVAVVPAAGSGKRLGLKKRLKKPFVLLGGRPLISYALAALESSKVIDGIVVAVEKSNIGRLKALIKRYGFAKVTDIVIGGSTRFESVRNCLKRVGPSFDIVLIHDGARPFLDKTLIEEAVSLAKKHGACVTAVPESDTVKVVERDSFVKRTIDRRFICRAQTPQAFRRELINKAYAVKGGSGITDDSSLVEKLGMPVKISKGSYRNIKITTKVDLKFAEVLLCGSV